MPRIEVQANVELFEHEEFEIVIQAYPKQGIGQWASLEGLGGGGSSFSVPPDQFSFDKKVPDIVCGRRDNQGFQWAPLGGEERRIPRGAIVVLLESPHVDEYELDREGFRPRQPLSNPSSRNALRNNIERIIHKASCKLGIGIGNEVDIVLCNPIQFQTSLHRFARPHSNGRQRALLHSVRNATWKAFWNFEKGDESFPFQADLFERLEQEGAPKMIINACTYDLRGYIDDFLGNNFPGSFVTVNRHVSVWNGNTDIISQHGCAE